VSLFTFPLPSFLQCSLHRQVENYHEKVSIISLNDKKSFCDSQDTADKSFDLSEHFHEQVVLRIPIGRSDSQRHDINKSTFPVVETEKIVYFDI